MPAMGLIIIIVNLERVVSSLKLVEDLRDFGFDL